MPAPMVDAERRTEMARHGKRSRISRSRRWLRRVAALLVVVALLPFGLPLLYRVPIVHPVSTLMIADLVTLQGYDRRWVPLEAVSPVAVHSVMMSEDGQFCSHRGIDWRALRQVVDEALAGDRPRGASTIPMQTVKNLFLWPSRSLLRKAIEVPLALYFDVVVPKRRIMEIYLNIAEWGPNIYGIEAAAQHHFGRSAHSLTARQAALLAVTLPSPETRNPANPPPGLGRLASIIERRARGAGGHVECLR